MEGGFLALNRDPEGVQIATAPVPTSAAEGMSAQSRYQTPFG